VVTDRHIHTDSQTHKPTPVQTYSLAFAGRINWSNFSVFLQDYQKDEAVCLFPLYFLNRLTSELEFFVCHDHSSSGIERQGYRSRSKVNDLREWVWYRSKAFGLTLILHRGQFSWFGCMDEWSCLESHQSETRALQHFISAQKVYEQYAYSQWFLCVPLAKHWCWCQLLKIFVYIFGVGNEILWAYDYWLLRQTIDDAGSPTQRTYIRSEKPARFDSFIAFRSARHVTTTLIYVSQASCARTAATESFGDWFVGRINYVLLAGQKRSRSPRKAAILGVVSAIAKHLESLLRCTQHLCCGVRSKKDHSILNNSMTADCNAPDGSVSHYIVSVKNLPHCDSAFRQTYLTIC